MKPTDGEDLKFWETKVKGTDVENNNNSSPFQLQIACRLMPSGHLYRGWRYAKPGTCNVEPTITWKTAPRVQTVLRQIVITEKQASKNKKLLKLTESADNNE